MSAPAGATALALEKWRAADTFVAEDLDLLSAAIASGVLNVEDPATAWQRATEYLEAFGDAEVNRVRQSEAMSHAARALADGTDTGNLFAGSLSEPPAFNAPRHVIPYLIPGFLPQGVVGALGGDGDVGKSQLMAQEAVCLALGRPFLGFDVPEARTSVIVTAEDDAATVWGKMRQVADGFGLGESEWREVCERVAVIDIRGRGVLFVKSDRHGRYVPDTDALTGLVGTILQKFTTPDVVYVDTMSKTLGLPEEGAPVAAYLRALEKLSDAFRCPPTVRFTQHTGKVSGARGDVSAHALRGASQASTDARFVHMLAQVVAGRHGNTGPVKDVIAQAPERVRPFLRVLSSRSKSFARMPPMVIEAVPLDPQDHPRGFFWRQYAPSATDRTTARHEAAERKEADVREVRNILAAVSAEKGKEWLAVRALRGRGIGKDALPDRLAAAVAAGLVEQRDEDGQLTYRAKNGEHDDHPNP